MCRSGCLTQEHATWGECARAANLRIGQVDATEQSKWDRELAEYRAATSAGIRPDGTKTSDTRSAVAHSEKWGKPYGTPEFKQAVRKDVMERVLNQ